MATTGAHTHSAASPDPPPIVAPPPGNPRFPLVDGLRAIAALSVVAIHCTVYTNYFSNIEGAYARQLAAGVTIFFVISGFLLYRPFVAARFGAARPIAVGAYFRRRLLRIVPAYWLALTILALYPGLPGHPLSPSHWLTYYGFGQDYMSGSLFDGLGTAWSLSTEVAFYLALPVYALILAQPRFNRSRKSSVSWDLTSLLLLAVGSLIFRYFVYGAHPNLCYTLLGTFDWFAIGMALAVVSVALHQGARLPIARLGHLPGGLSWLGALAAWSLAAYYWHHWYRYDPYTAGPLHLIWGLIALFVVLPAVFNSASGGFPRRFLSWPLIGWLGIISYGIYLWHLPLIPKIGHLTTSTLRLGPSGPLTTLAVFLVTTVVVTLCAALSYYLVEKPILRFKERRRSRSEAIPAPAATAALVD